MNPVGKPDAGNRHVRFDERGEETGRCRMAQATAPLLDSTRPSELRLLRSQMSSRRECSRPAPRRQCDRLASELVNRSIAFAVKSVSACANASSFCTTGRLRMHAIRDLPVAPTCRKVLVLRFAPNHEHHPRCPALAERGASRSSRTLSAGCDGRDGTSAQALRGRVMLSRTEKSCGPGIPTLMPSRRDVSPMTGARQPGPRGDREGNR